MLKITIKTVTTISFRIIFPIFKQIYKKVLYLSAFFSTLSIVLSFEIQFSTTTTDVGPLHPASQKER